MTIYKDNRFDGGYPMGSNHYLYKQLEELMPSEKQEIIDFIKPHNEYAFNIFKEECSEGWYSNVETKPPKKHTREELEEIKEDLMCILFDVI